MTTAGFARILGALSGLSALFAAGLAEACPACASRQDGGSGQTIALGALLVVPFAVSATVIRFIRSSGASVNGADDTDEVQQRSEAE